MPQGFVYRVHSDPRVLPSRWRLPTALRVPSRLQVTVQNARFPVLRGISLAQQPHVEEFARDLAMSRRPGCGCANSFQFAKASEVICVRLAVRTSES